MRHLIPLVLVSLTVAGCIHTSLLDVTIGIWLLLATSKIGK